MPSIKWIERSFNFNFPVELYPQIIERLRGAPARVDEYFNAAPAGVLSRRDDGHWSIQENAAHLFDLDALTLNRIDQYVAGLPVLLPADVTNKATTAANYNEVSAATISKSFRERRKQIVDKLESLDAEIFARSAVHPR